MKKKLASLFIVLLLSAGGPVQARIEPGRTVSFLQIGAGGRGAALGESYTTMSGDILASYFNPASMGGMKQQQFGFSHFRHVQDIAFNYLGYGLPVSKRMQVGFSLLHASYGAFEGTEVDIGMNRGSRTRLFQAQDLVGVVSLARTFVLMHRRISTGFSLKYLQESIADVQARGTAFDFGAVYIVSPMASLGFSARNLGEDIRHVTEKTPLPTSYNLGASVLLLRSIYLSSEAELPNQGKFSMKFGTEYTFGSRFSLRFGYRGTDIAGISAGMGLKTTRFGVDYAFIPFGELGSAHRISGTLHFGAVKE